MVHVVTITNSCYIEIHLNVESTDSNAVTPLGKVWHPARRSVRSSQLLSDITCRSVVTPCDPWPFPGWPAKPLLTYSIVQSPSWEANWFAASQEIPRISRNPKVHYRTHKRPPPVSILGHLNPVHIPTSHLLEIRPNIIHPSPPRSPQWSL